MSTRKEIRKAININKHNFSGDNLKRRMMKLNITSISQGSTWYVSLICRQLATESLMIGYRVPIVIIKKTPKTSTCCTFFTHLCMDIQNDEDAFLKPS